MVIIGIVLYKKKIIAIILAIVTVMTLASCGKKATDFNANTYEDRMADTVMEIDNMTYQYLGDNIIETEYKNGTYSIFLTVDGVNSSRLVMTSGLADSIGDLSRTIKRIFNVDCAITIMDDATHSKVLYGNLNGIDVTDYVN